MYYVYVIKSLKDEQLYFGYTSDLKKRIEKHQQGKVILTKPRRPFCLIYYESYYLKKLALNREKQLKHYSNAWMQLKRRIGNNKFIK